MKKLNLILSSILLMVLFIPLFLSFSIDEVKFPSNEDVLEFPLFTDDFILDLNEYIEQRSPYRAEIIEFNKQNNNISNSFDSMLNEYLKKNDPNYYKAKISYPVLYGRDDWLFYLGDNSLSFYLGKNSASSGELNEYYSVFKELNDICRAKNVSLVFLNCPNKEIVYSEYMPSFIIKNNYRRSVQIRNYLINNDINYLYPLEEIQEGKKDGLVYYMQDTHCNLRGAYILYKEAMNSVGRTISTPTFTLTSKYGGDISSMCGYYSTYEDYNLSYNEESTYEYHNIESGIYTTSSTGTDKLLIIGDSFRGYLCSYYNKDFNKVLSLGIDELENNSFLDEYINSFSSGDIIIIERVERMENDMLSIAKNLINYLK